MYKIILSIVLVTLTSIGAVAGESNYRLRCSPGNSNKLSKLNNQRDQNWAPVDGKHGQLEVAKGAESKIARLRKTIQSNDSRVTLLSQRMRWTANLLQIAENSLENFDKISGVLKKANAELNYSGLIRDLFRVAKSLSDDEELELVNQFSSLVLSNDTWRMTSFAFYYNLSGYTVEHLHRNLPSEIEQLNKEWQSMDQEIFEKQQASRSAETEIASLNAQLSKTGSVASLRNELSKIYDEEERLFAEVQAVENRCQKVYR